MAEERLGASFSIDVTQLKAGLAQANRLIRESESEFKAASAGMDDFTKSQDGLEAKIKSLNKIQAIQEEKVKALNKQYENLINDGVDPTSAQMVKLRTDINNATAALQKTTAETEKYEKALDDLGDDVNDFSEANEKAEKSSGALDVAVGNLAANLVSSLGSAIKDSISMLMNLAEETREYREDIGKLKTAFESAGKSTELATAVYKEFYSVLGEEDRSVEAVNHLAKLVDTEEDMAKWTDIATGVWGTFGDSLPIEGLTEAANETARTGELTGVLTDALNWAAEAGETFGVKQKAATEANEDWNKSVEEAKSAEDFFKLALQECSSEQERQTLITETLNGLYSEAASNYRENNKSVIEARKAASDYTDTMAELGEQMEPVNTAINEVKNEFAKEFIPVIKNDAIPMISDFMDELKADGSIKKFTKGISGIVKSVLPPLSKVLKFAAENTETLATVTLTAVTAYKALKAGMAVANAINATRTAIGALEVGTKAATVAQVGWNAAMSANPIGAVITAVSLLVGGIALFTSSAEEAKTQTDYLSESQRQAIDTAREAAEAYGETKQAAEEMAAAGVAQINHVQQLWQELKNLADENGRVQDSDRARAEFIIGELNNALGTEYSMNGNIIQSYQDIKSSIEDVIETKKAQILLQAYEETYAEAVKNITASEKERAIQAQELSKLQERLGETELRIATEKLRYDQMVAQGREAEMQKSALLISQYENEANELKKNLDKKAGELSESDKIVEQYYSDINNYETASTLILAGETDKAVTQLERYGDGFKTAASVAKESKNEQLRILREQVVETEVNLGILEANYAKSQENMTEEERKQAEARIENARQQAKSAKDEYYKVGGNMVEGMAKGAEDGEWTLTGALKSTVEKALNSAKRILGIASPSKVFKKQVGLMIPFGIAAGIDDGTGKIVKSIKKQSEEMEEAYELPTVASRVETAMNKGKATSRANDKDENKSVTVYQTNNYSQAHSRYEIYKSKEQTTAAVRLALLGV